MIKGIEKAANALEWLEGLKQRWETDSDDVEMREMEAPEALKRVGVNVIRLPYDRRPYEDENWLYRLGVSKDRHEWNMQQSFEDNLLDALKYLPGEEATETLEKRSFVFPVPLGLPGRTTAGLGAGAAPERRWAVDWLGITKRETRRV